MTYAKHVKDRLSRYPLEREQRYVDKLAEGYLRGFHNICEIEADSATKSLDQAAIDCLAGLNILACVVDEDMTTMIQKSICRAIFAVEWVPASPEPYLEPEVREVRSLTSVVLQSQSKRPNIATQSGGLVGSLLAGKYAESHRQLVYRQHRLRLFIDLVDTYETLPIGSPTGKKTRVAAKAREEGDRQRPMRVALEAFIARCELATALASTNISNVKDRSRPGKEMEKDLVAGSGSDSDGGGEVEDDVDIKPVLQKGQERTPPNQSQKVANEDSGSSTSTAHVQARKEFRWAEEAKTTLLECLQHAHLAVEARCLNVVTQSIRPTEWYPEGDPSEPVRSTCDLDDGTRIGSVGSTSDSEGEDDEDEDDESASSDPAARPPPLKIIFRLQDRYEELRLAVWLSLPPDRRGNMSAYMRGVPTPDEIAAMEESGLDPALIEAKKGGEVGKAWDELGLALLKHFEG